MEYDLNRFIDAQEFSYNIALQEIKSGYKNSHWIWYIFPQIAGLGHSFMAKKYEIKDLEEAKAYMKNDYLKNHLIEITKALLECKNDNIEEIMGFPDNLKVCSCMTLFNYVAPEIEEFKKVLNRFYNGIEDKNTLYLIEDKKKEQT